MRAVVHIGCIKTGTSSIQSFLFNNRELLLEQGCLYPQCLVHPVHSRTRGIVNHNVLSLHLGNNWPGDFLNPLRAELRASGCRLLLISGEIFSSDFKTPEQLLRLRGFLQALECDDISIMVWLRECGAMFSSMCSQWLRNGCCEWVHALPPQSNPKFRFIMDYRSLLQRWAGVFGREALQVRLFERGCFADGDLLHDAIAAAGLSWDERFVPPPRVNESLNLLEMEVLRAVNHLVQGREFMDGTPRSALCDALYRHTQLLDAPALRFVPPAKIVQAWREWTAQSNEWVRREFFPGRRTLFESPGELQENYAIAGMLPEAWEAIGRAMADLALENCRLRRKLQQAGVGD